MTEILKRLAFVGASVSVMLVALGIAMSGDGNAPSGAARASVHPVEQPVKTPDRLVSAPTVLPDHAAFEAHEVSRSALGALPPRASMGSGGGELLAWSRFQR